MWRILICVLLAGCAGSAPDLDFRRKVKSETTAIAVTPLVTISETVEFRDPGPPPPKPTSAIQSPASQGKSR